MSIINLITLLGREASNEDNENPLFNELALALNQMKPMNREQALFKALQNTDDDVRLAVVRSFFVIPLDQLDEKEIADIVAIADTCTNFAAGKTETILSVVFWIFFKLTKVEEIHEEEIGSPETVAREKA